MGKWENHGKNHGKIGKPMGKAWKILGHIGTAEGFNGGFNGKYHEISLSKMNGKIPETELFLRLGSGLRENMGTTNVKLLTPRCPS